MSEKHSTTLKNQILNIVNVKHNILRREIQESIKEIKETLQLIERFLGEDYAKLKEEESHLLEKDE